MPDLKISELAAASSVAVTDQVPLNQSGTTRRATMAQIGGLLTSIDNPENLFINGGPDIWQRGASDAAVTTARKYVADRWAVTCGAGTLTTVARSTTVRTGHRSAYSMELQGTAGVTTVDIDQRIESIMDGAYKRTLAFSVYVYNGTGASFTPKLFVSTPTAAVADSWVPATVRNGGGAGEDLQACADSQWTQVTWTGDVSGYTNIDYGVEFKLRIPSGSLVAGDTVRLAEFNLIPSATAADYVSRHYAQDLALCQRYWLTYPVSTTDSFGYGFAVSTTVVRGFIPTPVEMRTAPTITGFGSLHGAAASVAITSIDNIVVKSSGIRCYFNVAAGLTANEIYIADVVTSSVTLSAEL